MARWCILLLLLGCSPSSPLTVSGPPADLSGVHSSGDLAPANDLSVPNVSVADLNVADASAFDLLNAKAGGPDGVCSPGPMSSGLYDPDCVYLLGTLRPSFAGWEALVLPALPNDYAVGFYTPLFSVIRPGDGRMLLLDQSTAYVFQPSSIPAGGSYPPSASQELATPACPHMVGGVFVFPDDSQAAYECLNHQSALFLEGQSTVLYTVDVHPIALGAGRVVLGKSAQTLTLFTPGGNITVTNAWTNATAVAARYLPDGFLVAVENNTSPLVVKQVKVAIDGTAKTMGSYQLGSYTLFQHCAMEPGGAIQCSYDLPAPADMIQRFTLTAPPQQLYDDKNNPVKIFSSNLVTGP